MPRLRIALTLWLAAAAFAGASQAPSPGEATRRVRFHHIHFRVGDPSAAMNAVAAKLEGVRVIVPGLGVGVRVGTEYLLFDRLTETDPAGGSRPLLREAYVSAARWLASHGIQADPADPSQLRAPAQLLDEHHDHIAFVADDLPGLKAAWTAAGAVPVRISDDAVLFDAGAGLLIELVRDADRTETFWCPMHPDIRSADAGKCPACGMTLVPIPPPKIGEYKLDVTQVRDPVRRRVTGLGLSVREPDTNARVERFSVMHEKRLHLFVVSRDLDYFAHVHPEQVDGGAFTLAHPLPAGDYMLIADFLPEGGTLQMVQKAIIVTGSPAGRAPAASADGLKVSLRAENLAAGKHALLTFTVTDATTGAPVTDLQPYLGAPAHMLLVRRDLTDAVHSHPEEQVTSGPAVSFHPIMPAPGDYRLWVQFQRGGRVSTTSFDLAVAR
jgi:hypothetical protein